MVEYLYQLMKYIKYKSKMPHRFFVYNDCIHYGGDTPRDITKPKCINNTETKTNVQTTLNNALIPISGKPLNCTPLGVPNNLYLVFEQIFQKPVL